MAQATITIPIDEELLKQLEEKAAKESRTTEEVANELLRQSLEKPYKLELQGWNAEILVDVTDRDKLYDVLDDDEYMKRRGF